MTAINYIESVRRLPLVTANAEMENVCGISGFFEDHDDFSMTFLPSDEVRLGKDEYGDWQTNPGLCLSICRLLKARGLHPKVLIEPTCGRGNFIMAALQTFDCLEEIYAIEIYRPYVNDLKLRLLQYCIDNVQARKVNVHIYNEDVFTFDFQKIRRNLNGRETLVIGNPPWVTNSMIGTIKGSNIPEKVNFKHIKGLDAITGKGNFDIAEYICMKIFSVFSDSGTKFAMLLKNSVIRNIVYDQKRGDFRLGSIIQYEIDAKKEFGAYVSASLLCLEFGNTETEICHVRDFYTDRPLNVYGWVGDNFVADIKCFECYGYMDGTSPLQWRSGIKHDCAKVMELSFVGGRLVNGLGEIVEIEDEVLYPLVKSSDIKGDVIDSVKKYVIVTQHYSAEDTGWIKEKCPLAYKYLLDHADRLDKRGSSIYRGRPRFCLFGIGDYSFKRYKIIISGLYKHALFSLAVPINGKPVMADDTCYLLGFDNKDYAAVTLKILNSPAVRSFISSLTFEDAKRVINKDILMCVDLYKAARHIDYSDLGIDRIDFENYLNFLMENKRAVQGSLF